MELILATKNKHKVEELKKLFDDADLKMFSLLDLPNIPDVVEDGKTFLENARKKAREIAAFTGKMTLADDTGLAVDALGGAPGVYSARYSGRDKDYQANNQKLLEEMKKIPDEKRQAAFFCVMVLITPDGKEFDVEGRCEGLILRELKGDSGFGYDPLFFIPHLNKTLAELTMDEKNKISHRGNALRKIREIIRDRLIKL
ncbi:MAG: XTP/dITP diphosphatase [Pseudomonadota bacterium]